ncbi:replication initiation protein [Tortoise microvirus 66]|nr:replication initiation protein [Tortoise microvirus 66]
MSCFSPVTIRVKGSSFSVPCHHCMSCRFTYQSYLLFCCQRELQTAYERGLGASFVTYTYSDDHLPVSGSLDKKEFQNMLKRVRKTHSLPPFKYIACGEYGDRFGRAHYHSVFFGLSDVLAQAFVKPHWHGGICRVETLRSASGLRYVLDYCCKSINGKMAEEMYDNQGIERPFLTHSIKLGRDWLNAHMDEIVSDGFNYRDKGVLRPLPKYFRDIYDVYGCFDVVPALTGLSKDARSRGFLDIYSYSDFMRPAREKLLIDKFRASGRPVDDSEYLIATRVATGSSPSLARSLLERT